MSAPASSQVDIQAHDGVSRFLRLLFYWNLRSKLAWSPLFSPPFSKTRRWKRHDFPLFSSKSWEVHSMEFLLRAPPLVSKIREFEWHGCAIKGRQRKWWLCEKGLRWMMMGWRSLRLPKQFKDLFMERAGVGLSYQKGGDSASWLSVLLSLNPKANPE